MVEPPASSLHGDLKAREPPAKCQRIRPFWRTWGFRFVSTTVCAAAAAAAAAAATARWRLPRPESTPVTTHDVASFPSFADVSFSVAGIASGLRHGGPARPSCEPSDDPEYACLLSRPPGAFDKEFMVYLSAGYGQLSVKVVVVAVAGLLRDGGGGGGGQAGEAGWVSVGFSPDGRMAGPSEAVVGFLSEAAADGTQGPEVLRYRMDGYSPSSVVHLPEEEGEERRCRVLSGKAIETDANGSLTLRFKRPFSLPATRRGYFFTSEGVSGGRPLPSPRDSDFSDTDTPLLPPAEAVEGARHLQQILSQQPSLREEGNDRVRSEACGDDEGLPWLDPRDEGVVLLWAYATRGSPWPGYHDRTGCFPLPRLPGDGLGVA